MLSSLVAPAGLIAAQSAESTEEPATTVPTDPPATEAPTEAPTEPPATEAPTEAPTETAPEGTAEVPATETPPATAVPPTATPVPATVEPSPAPTEQTPAVWGDDFEDGDTLGWVLSAGWTVGVTTDGSLALMTSGPQETAVISGLVWEHLAVSARIGLAPGATAIVAVRAGASNYNVALDANGRVTLYQGATLLAEGPPIPAAEGTPDPAPVWYTLGVTAQGGQLAVSVDGVQQIATTVAAPLPAGGVIFSTGPANAAAVQIDDVLIQRMPPPAPDAPTTTPEPVEPTPEEVTPEATPELTGEAPATMTPAPETTDEAPELTEEPGITETPAAPEVTAEPEITEEPELTEEPEATPEPEATEEPDVPGEEGPQPVLSADFEGELVGWQLVDGASVISGDSNSAAMLPPGGGVLPAETLMMNALQIDLRATLLSEGDQAAGMVDVAAESTAEATAEVPAPEAPVVALPESGLTLAFHINGESAYLLAVAADEFALYRRTAEGLTLLTSVAAQHEIGAWFDLSLSVEAGQIVVSENGTVVLSHADPNALPGGEIAFTGAANSLIDDVAVYDFSPPGSIETPAPLTLTDDNRVKFSGALVNLLEAYLAGDDEAAQALITDHYIETDDEGRIRVTVWGAELATADIAALVTAAGGVLVEDAASDDASVEAFIGYEGLLELANDDNIAAIYLPQIMVSTGLNASANAAVAQATGSVTPHSLNHLGVNDWHLAGATGAGVRIGVVDTGFSGASATGDLACLGSTSVYGAQTGNHGLNVIEVICDIAPNADVFMYGVNNVGVIDDRINQARQGTGFGNNPMDIILVTIDDQFTGGAEVGNIRTAITNAHNAGIPVIASAGNRGTSGSGTFQYTGDGARGEALVTTSAGAVITYRWDDTTGAQNLIATLGDSSGAVIDSRMIRVGDDPAHQFVVPESCGDACTLTLAVEGDTATTVEVLTSDGNVAMGIGLQPMVNDTGGSLTTAAGAENSIAVGAVCGWQGDGSSFDRYPILSNSSRGTVGAGTMNVKPEVVSISNVGTLNTGGLPDPNCDPTNPGNGEGFGGTSASASHIAGMAALLFSNNSNLSMVNYFNSGNRAANLETYLMTRSIDLYDGASADGFDNTYGAGLSVLGDPSFNMATAVNYSRYADPVGSGPLIGNAYYVGTAGTATADTLGSPGNPYISPAFAIEEAINDGKAYVIFMPGEYVSSFEIPDPTGANSLTVTSYDEIDEFNWPASTIWTIDTFEGLGGVYMENVQNVTLQGFDFTGSTPDYNFDLPPDLALAGVTPFYISNSSNVVIAGNTFTNFDRASVIADTSFNVAINRNTFTDYNNPELLLFPGPIPVPAFIGAGAVIEVIDSGRGGSKGFTTGNEIVINRNRFENNVAPHDPTTDFKMGVVGIERSRVDIFSNVFTGNDTPSVVSANQWLDQLAGTKVLDQIRFYGNALDSNTIYGPVIHLMQAPNFRFVNNTVANHTLAGENGAVIGIGEISDNPGLYTDVADHRWEFYNNLMFNNQVQAGLIVAWFTNGEGQKATGLGNEGCRHIFDDDSSGSQDAAQHNWFIIDDTSGFLFGECTDSISGGTNDNIITTIDLDSETAISEFEQATFFMQRDPQHPYRLLPYDLDNPPVGDPLFYIPTGVEAGDNPASNVIVGEFDVDTNLVLDASGLPRLVDREISDGPNNPEIDIGAYELSDPEPASFINDNGDFSTTGQEDSVIRFELDVRTEGGYEPYEFLIVTEPTVYDDDPLNACGGEPLALTRENTDDGWRYWADYCPPADFHTSTQSGQNPQLPPDVTFTYRVKGLLDENYTDEVGTGTINVNAVEETDGTGLNTGDMQTIFTTIASPIENYRLRPYVDFGADGPIFSDDDSVDYGFKFSNFNVDEGTAGYNAALFSGNPDTIIQGAVTNGLLNFTPATGETGAFEFTYTVTDQHNNTVTRRVRVVVTQRIAGPGLHDETSLNFVYQNPDPNQSGWTPWYYDAAINNTIHWTQVSSATAEFYFVGDAFNLYWYAYSTAGSYTLYIDPDDEGPMTRRPYNAAEFGLTCSNPAKPSTISTAQANTGFTSFGCSGLQDITETIGEDTFNARDQLRRLEIVANSGAINLDAISIRGDGLPPGIYQEDDFQLAYTGSWATLNNASANGGSYVQSNASNAGVSFVVDGDLVDTLVLHRVIGMGWGSFNVEVNGAVAATFDNAYSATRWGQPAVVGGIGSGLQTIEIVPTAPGEWINVEAIELLGSLPALAPGDYAAEDGRIEYVGNWINTAYDDASDGTWRTSSDLNATLTFEITNAGGAIIYRSTGSTYGSMQVCIDDNCQTFSNVSPLFQWRVPAVIRAETTGTHTVTVRSLDTRLLPIEDITVLGAPQALGVGSYAHTDENLIYTGNWRTYNASWGDDGKVIGTNETDDLMTFYVDTTNADRLAINYPNWGGTMQVCGANCATIPMTGSDNGNRAVLTMQELGLTGGNAEVNILSLGGWIGVDSLEVLAEPSALTPGTYAETDGNIILNGGWSSWPETWATDGTVTGTTTPGDTLTFSVDSTSLDRIAIHYANWGGTMRVCGPSATCVTRATTGWSNGLWWIIPKASLGLTNGTSDLVTIDTTSGWIGISAIRLFEPQQALTTNHYEETDDRFNFSGAWRAYSGYTWSDDGTVIGTNQTSATLTFTVNADSMNHMTITYPNWGGTMQVCGAACKTVPSGTDASSGAVTFTKGELGLSGTNAPVTIKTTGGWIGIDSVEVFGQPVALGIGTYLHTDERLVFSSGWSLWPVGWNTTGELRGTPNASDSLTFYVDSGNMARLAVHYPNWGGTMRICGPGQSGGTCPTITTTGWDNGNWAIFNKNQLNLTTGPQQVTITTASGWIGVSAIRIMGTQEPLDAGSTYEDTDDDLAFNGGWRSYSYDWPDNGTVVGTNSTAARLNFNVDVSGDMSHITVQYANWGGTMRVCGNVCKSVVTDGTGSYSTATFTKQELDLFGTNPAVEISTTSGWVGIDTITVYDTPAPLAPGYYEESNTGLVFTSGWSSWPASWGDGTIFGTDGNESLTFNVNASQMDRLVIYYPTWGGTMQICANSCTEVTTASVPGWTLGVRAVVSKVQLGLTNETNAQISISREPGAWIGIEALEILATQTALTPGEYENTDDNFSFAGAWNDYTGYAWTDDDSITGTNITSAALTFNVNSTQMERVAIYYPNWSGTMRVCGPSQSGSQCPTVDQSTGSANGNVVIFTKAQLGLSGTADRITITAIDPNTADTTPAGWIGIDKIEVLGSNAALTPGYYEEDAVDLTYSGDWSDWSAGWGDGTITGTPNTGATLTFTVDSTQMDRIAINYPAWGGTMQVCGTTCDNFTTSGWTNGVWRVINKGTLGLTGTAAPVTITTTGGWIGIEALRILAPQQALTSTNTYEETDDNLNFNGEWRGYVTSFADDDTSFGTNQTDASLTFTVDATDVDLLVIRYPHWGGTMNVCGTGGSCVQVEQDGAGSSGEVALSPASDLGLSGTTETVTIATLSGWIGIDRIVAGDGRAALPAGYYDETNINILYDGASWASGTSGNYAGGSAAWTNQNGQSFDFAIDDATGFILYMGRYSSAATMDVCYTPSGGGASTCQTVDAAQPTTNYTYGFSFFGLEAGDYDITVTHVGSNGEWLHVDAVGVLGTTSGTLGVGLHDERDPAITYGPSLLWSQGSNAAYIDSTWTWTRRSGATVQMAVEGNAVTVYMYAAAGASAEIDFCLIQTVNDANSLQCTDFSSASPVTTLQMPITIYGLGGGTHDIILDNRQDGGGFTLDAIEVHD